MQKRIFYSIFLLCAFLLVLSNIFLLFNAEFFIKKHIKNDLIKQANSLLNAKDFNPSPLKQSDFSTQNRISIIDEKGEVLFDNFASNLQNHLDREEIKETLKNGESFKIRYSQSLKQDLLYYAKAFKDNNQTQIIRIATPKKSISDFMVHIILFFALELCLLLVFCFVLARFLTSWILSPIKNINLEQIDKKGVYTELHSFIKKIKSQNKTIKKSYKKLMQKQQEGILLAQNIKDGFILLNAKGGIVLANIAIEQFLSLNQKSSILDIENSQFSQLVLRLIADFKAQNLKENQISQMQLKDLECEIIFSPIFVESKFKGLMILIQNLSKEKDAQNLRKEFSANVTHELKTPLTSILASSEMMKNHLVKAEDTPHFIDRIYKESKRLLEMIDEILLLSFFDENKQETLQKEQVSLKKIILNVISRLNSVAKSHNIQLNSDLEDIEILGVYELLENLIYNLCDNAIKYNKQNGFVHISLKKEQNQIKLSVKDSGIGIKKEHQIRIFERFFCVDKSRSKSLGGTGLGLSIVKHACLYHKAKINLESKLGEGSEFCIIFEDKD